MRHEPQGREVRRVLARAAREARRLAAVITRPGRVWLRRRTGPLRRATRRGARLAVDRTREVAERLPRPTRRQALPRATGGMLAAPVWGRAFARIHGQRPVRGTFHPPDGDDAEGGAFSRLLGWLEELVGAGDDVESGGG